MTPSLSVKDLSVKYGSHKALDSVSVQVFPGEVVGLIGPNGAGKTSFIKAICGRVASTGQIYLGGTLMARGQCRQKQMGLVPQDIGLYGHLTCRENLDVFGRLMGIDAAHRLERVEDALKAVDLIEKSNHLASHLSGGMKRRLNVAAAIMHGPDFLILDEPTAGTDMPARDSIHRLARRLAESGIGILLVTHELEQVEALCDRVLFFVLGQCVADGAPTQILERFFGDRREIFLRFAECPNASGTLQLGEFDFVEGELPTLWTCVTEKSILETHADILSQLQNDHPKIREVGIRRPGLPTLMQIVQKTGALPC